MLERADEAEEQYKLALTAYEASSDEKRSGDHGATLYNYGVLLHEAKRFDDAQRVLQDAVAVVREVYGEEHASFEQVFGELEEVRSKLASS